MASDCEGGEVMINWDRRLCPLTKNWVMREASNKHSQLIGRLEDPLLPKFIAIAYRR